MKYYIRGDYYVDIDLYNQLRITGPENHLLFGVSLPDNLDVKIESCELENEQLTVILKIPEQAVEIEIPLVTDIRTLRHYVESTRPVPTYKHLVMQNITDVMPRSIKSEVEADGSHSLSFINSYVDGQETKQYGSAIIVPSTYQLELKEGKVLISAEEPLTVTIKTITNIAISDRLTTPVFALKQSLPGSLFSPFLLELYEESRINIEHLVRAKKTSSFEYGTIFPRDWIESADLGGNDLSIETIDYMYEQSLKFATGAGEGWHEDVVGEFKTKMDVDQHIDRKMVDIEPHYILGIPMVSKRFLTNEANQKKLAAVAQFIVHNADNNRLVTFKKKV